MDGSLFHECCHTSFAYTILLTLHLHTQPYWGTVFSSDIEAPPDSGGHVAHSYQIARSLSLKP